MVFAKRAVAFVAPLEIKPQIHRVPIVLRDAEVSPRDGEGTVVVDVHQDDRGHAVFPSVIAEGLPQGVTGHAVQKPQRFGGGADEAVGLNPADCLSGTPVLDKGRAGPGGERVGGQGGFDSRVERDGFDLPGFLLGDGHAVADALVFKVIHIVPTKAQQVADAERGIEAHDNEDIIADLTAFEVVRRELADLVLVTDGFCGFHRGILPT